MACLSLSVPFCASESRAAPVLGAVLGTVLCQPFCAAIESRLLCCRCVCLTALLGAMDLVMDNVAVVYMYSCWTAGLL